MFAWNYIDGSMLSIEYNKNSFLIQFLLVMMLETELSSFYAKIN